MNNRDNQPNPSATSYRRAAAMASLIALGLGVTAACDSDFESEGIELDDARIGPSPIVPNVGGTVCKPWKISFAGECVTKKNLHNTVDFDDMNADLLDVMRCRDADDKRITECIEILVDLGEPGLEQVMYRLSELECFSTPTQPECFGGFVAVHRVVYDTTALIEDDTRMVDIVATYQYPDAKFGVSSGWGPTPVEVGWFDDFTIAATHYADGVSSSSGLGITNAYAIYDEDGTLLDSDSEYYNSIASSTGDGCDDDVECKCEILAGAIADIAAGSTQMAGAGSCAVLPSEVSVSTKVGEDTTLAGKLTPNPCESSQRGFERILNGTSTKKLGGLAALAALACEAAVHEFWPGQFGPDDALPTLPDADLDVWLPEEPGVQCEALGFSTMEFREWINDKGQHCNANVPVSYECGDNGTGDCECQDTPDFSAAEEDGEACTS